jgi:transcriptional regulator with XRE-family HTH domain
MSFSATIREARVGLRISQRELARRLEISQQHLSLLERGGCHPSVGLYLALIDALGLDPAVGMHAPDLRGLDEVVAA